jgi:hypothetical protein
MLAVSATRFKDSDAALDVQFKLICFIKPIFRRLEGGLSCNIFVLQRISVPFSKKQIL